MSKMIKDIIAKRFLLIILAIIALNGCIFIVKDEQPVKYYGIDDQRGKEYLNQILDKQQKVYQTEK